MRFKIMEIKNELSNTKQGKEVVENYFMLKVNTVDNLLKLL